MHEKLENKIETLSTIFVVLFDKNSTKEHLPSWYLISIDLTLKKDKPSTFHNVCGRKKTYGID